LAATAPAALDAIALSSDDSEALAVGAGGTAFARFGTGSFTTLATGSTENLHAAIIPSSNPDLYIAGDNGTLLTSADEGAHWTVVPLSISTPIYALDSLDDL
jgi:photosystem II stability/assembly factor-like uncharacterized protein